MTTVTITVKDLKVLREHALKAGTWVEWSELALEWCEQADAKIKKLIAENDDDNHTI